MKSFVASLVISLAVLPLFVLAADYRDDVRRLQSEVDELQQGVEDNEQRQRNLQNDRENERIYRESQDPNVPNRVPRGYPAGEDEDGD